MSKESIDQEHKAMHDSLTSAWILQGKPEDIIIEGKPFNFKALHDQNWKDHYNALLDGGYIQEQPPQPDLVSLAESLLQLEERLTQLEQRS